MSSSRSTAMSNSDKSRCKLTEQTMIRVRINLVQHSQYSNMTSMTQGQETLIRAKFGHRTQLALEKLKMTFSSRTQHWRSILQDWENKCIDIATKQHRCPQRHASPTLKYQFFGRHGRQYHAHDLRRWACCQTSRQECQCWDYGKC